MKNNEIMYINWGFKEYAGYLHDIAYLNRGINEGAFSLFLSCIDLKDWFIADKKFSMSKVPYTGDELRIDGYYYDKIWTDGSHVTHILVFYTNGIIFKVGLTGSLNYIEDRLCDHNFIKKIQNSLDCWGPYQIENENLKFEYYNIRGNSWFTFFAYCDIINDSTFIIKKTTFSKTGKEDKESSSFLDEYHFKQFSPKPDSTNSVVP